MGVDREQSMTRYSAFALVLFGMLWPCSAALAQTPSTRPADSVTIAVMPFNIIGDAGHEWVAPALQESLSNGIQNNSLSTLAIHATVPDAGSARTVAQSAGADYVVFGSVQFVDDQMRITGQVLNIATAKSAGKLAVDANLKDLFSVEDILTDRVRRLVAPPAPRAPAPRPTIELRGPVALNQPKYFDRDFSAAINLPKKFQAQYDQYYYHSTADCYLGFYGCTTWGCAPFGCFAFPIGCGPVVGSPAAHWSGW
jgi:TolB-like protein